MNETIQNFLTALEQIEEAHYTIPRALLSDEKINIYNDKYYTYENNFVTILNEKYAILNNLKIISEPSELIRQFQIPKRLVYPFERDPISEKCAEMIYKFFGTDANLVQELELIPDFIIHRNQNDNELTNQRLIAEVKTEINLSYKKFIWDFFKLNIYTEKIPFQNGVFLSINTKQSQIEEFVNKYLMSQLYLTSRTNSIYIIIKENYSATSITRQLSEFI